MTEKNENPWYEDLKIWFENLTGWNWVAIVLGLLLVFVGVYAGVNWLIGNRATTPSPVPTISLMNTVLTAQATEDVTLVPSPTNNPTLIPTSTPTLAPTDEPTAIPTNVPTLVPTDVPTLAPTDEPAIPTDDPDPTPTQIANAGNTGTISQGSWEVELYEGSTEQIDDWFALLNDPSPEVWQRFPNVDNPVVGFVAGDGLEYGLDESVFMEQNQKGNFPVQARGYRLITGDYNVFGVDECSFEVDQTGCAIAIFNIGEVTADFEATVRQGFTVTGRYWNGDTLDIAMWALSSHTIANMLNMDTFGVDDQIMNQPDLTNAGANCSVVDGCERVRFVIAIVSGNQLLAKAIIFVP